jgi:hypothetical protein
MSYKQSGLRSSSRNKSNRATISAPAVQVGSTSAALVKPKTHIYVTSTTKQAQYRLLASQDLSKVPARESTNRAVPTQSEICETIVLSSASGPPEFEVRIQTCT